MKWFFAILLGFGIWNLGFVPPSAEAACYPVNPQTGGCASSLATCSNDTTCCDNNNECTERTQSCSSDKPWERIPTCDVCGNILFCSGNNYRLCSTDSTFPAPQIGINRSTYVANSPASVTFNGVSYSVPSGGLYYCDSNAFGCVNPACSSNRNGGAGESRLWIPHLRNISALATLLQTLFAPAPGTFIKNALPSKSDQTAGLDNPAAVTTRIDYHQGFDDRTITVGDEKNNSSLIQGREAPAPLYNFGGSESYKQSGLCTITDAKTNPGDDLLGPKNITARLTYTQKYTYKTAPHPAGCKEDNDSFSVFGSGPRPKCCSEYAGNGYSSLQPGSVVVPNPRGLTQVTYKCAPRADRDFPTEGRAVVYTKTPLVEYIYNTLVVGPQSVLKRIFPSGNPQEFKEIPGQANFAASAIGLNQDSQKVNIKAGGGSTPPTLNFPHLGSLYEYFLVGLQKALRPLGGAFGLPVSPPSLSGNCNTVAEATTSVPTCSSGSSLPFPYACGINSELKTIIQEAGGAYGVPPAIIAGILSIETRNGVFSAPLDQKYLCEPNSCGAMGAMQLLTGYGVQSSCSQAIGINRWQEYACGTAGQNPNPGNIRDSVFAGAKMIKTISGSSSSSNWDQNTVFKVANSYYGNCTSTFNLKSNLEYSNSCLPLPPNIPENDFSYCDYLWYYYAPRSNQVAIPPLPVPTPNIR